MTPHTTTANIIISVIGTVIAVPVVTVVPVRTYVNAARTKSNSTAFAVVTAPALSVTNAARAKTYRFITIPPLRNYCR